MPTLPERFQGLRTHTPYEQGGIFVSQNGFEVVTKVVAFRATISIYRI